MKFPCQWKMNCIQKCILGIHKNNFLNFDSDIGRYWMQKNFMVTDKFKHIKIPTFAYGELLAFKKKIMQNDEIEWKHSSK